MTEERLNELLALHKLTSLTLEQKKSLTKRERTRHSLFNYNRSAAISFIIAKEREEGKDNPDIEKISYYQDKIFSFLEIAHRYKD